MHLSQGFAVATLVVALASVTAVEAGALRWIERELAVSEAALSRCMCDRTVATLRSLTTLAATNAAIIKHTGQAARSLTWIQQPPRRGRRPSRSSFSTLS